MRKQEKKGAIFATTLAVSLFLLIAACAGKHNTHRPTFLLGYRDRRCFKEAFYFGSTFELYAELIEPETLLDEFIKKEETDGIHYHVVY